MVTPSPAAVASSRTATARRKPRTEFTIDVFPHVKKFILKTYPSCITPGGSIKVEEYTTLGKHITLALREPESAENNDQYRDRLTETVSLILTKKQSDLGPRINKLMRINTDMDRVFKDHLLSWITALNFSRIPPYSACRRFLEYYGIDENEYSLDAAYRYYQRYAVKINP